MPCACLTNGRFLNQPNGQEQLSKQRPYRRNPAEYGGEEIDTEIKAYHETVNKHLMTVETHQKYSGA
eukprot:scaffold232826_cov53-Attheya_sp.AAC.2